MFDEQVKTTEAPNDMTYQDLYEWVKSVYEFCIPENAEPGTHPFGVLDYQDMEQIGAFLKAQEKKAAANAALLDEIAAKNSAISNLVEENKYFLDNMNDLRDKLDDCEDKLADQTHQTVYAEIEREALKEVIKKLEWTTDAWDDYCPSCMNYRYKGHDDDCELAAALKAGQA